VDGVVGVESPIPDAASLRSVLMFDTRTGTRTVRIKQQRADGPETGYVVGCVIDQATLSLLLTVSTGQIVRLKGVDA
jgi:hypothetical protein